MIRPSLSALIDQLSGIGGDDKTETEPPWMEKVV